ncbi:protein of unknown function (DU1801) [Formosa sp. Hel1_31_208]|uniref:DUF1801 domain-containing protein n=1 Tax=Formosa sp. Hel1_31_208 TaxID=1798225 RepID=UPI00087B5FC1|nr:DUF1801 domain-containing protein [Formosa sp. Hel1_31_208]SDS02668.1 protein of unknown function (DU1801) [Formosa sp. Hel1_31_208]
MNPAEVYILKQPEPYKSILLHVQILIEHVFPDAELKYKWRIPCYYIGTRPICYLNQSKNYIDVGFWHSAHITKHTEHLVTENRKVVKSLRYNTLDDINDEILIRILEEVEKHKNKSFLK